MKTNSHDNAGAAKFVAAGFLTLFFRYLTSWSAPILHLSNISPILATSMAGAKKFGPWRSAAYCLINMVALDWVTGRMGTWTVHTSLTYAIVALIGGSLVTNMKGGMVRFLLVTVMCTLIFDYVTGIMMSDLSWQDAAFGQISFTLSHLGGNVFFALFYKEIAAFYSEISEKKDFSPVLYQGAIA